MSCHEGYKPTLFLVRRSLAAGDTEIGSDTSRLWVSIRLQGLPVCSACVKAVSHDASFICTTQMLHMNSVEALLLTRFAAQASGC